MPSNPMSPPPNDPPASEVALAPKIAPPPPLPSNPPPPVPPLVVVPPTSPLRPLLAVLLSLGLGLFLADAIISVADDSLALIFGLHFLAAIRWMVCLLAMLLAVVIYALMAITPMIPKRWFLPLTLCYPVAQLLMLPFFIYYYNTWRQVAWVFSCGQVILGCFILYRIQGGLKFRWPLVPAERLEVRRFSWRNLCGFVAMNVFAFLPAVLIHLGLCAGLAVDHFTDGFMALRPSGFTVQARKYVRDDGKTVRLFPMAHVAEADFYQNISKTFPTNSIILMEGVSDDQNLLTNKITYKRMANSLGLAEQQEEFAPTQGKMIPADLDVSQFSTNTLGLLNLVMLIHSKGANAEILQQFFQYSSSGGERELLEDLLHKRNLHLVRELRTRLADSDEFVVPWGVAHMPEIAREIQKLGFRLEESQNYQVMRFGGKGKDRKKNSP